MFQNIYNFAVENQSVIMPIFSILSLHFLPNKVSNVVVDVVKVLITKNDKKVTSGDR